MNFAFRTVHFTLALGLLLTVTILSQAVSTRSHVQRATRVTAKTRICRRSYNPGLGRVAPTEESS